MMKWPNGGIRGGGRGEENEVRRFKDGYVKPKNGWTCYHCGQTFTTYGSAQDHFGKTPASKPGCLIKVEYGDEMGLLMDLRKAESLAAEMLIRAQLAEGREESLASQVAEFERIAGGGVHELRMKIDSWEGRTVTANALIEGFRERDPARFAEVVG